MDIKDHAKNTDTWLRGFFILVFGVIFYFLYILIWLLAQFASQLPSRVIGELIGIPPERRAAFLEWTESMISPDPERDRYHYQCHRLYNH